MEMTRKINVTILGKQFGLQTSSERQERFVRIAADTLNRMVEQCSAQFQQSDTVDVLIFVALNICMKKLNVEEEMKNLQAEADALKGSLRAILKTLMENNPLVTYLLNSTLIK